MTRFASLILYCLTLATNSYAACNIVNDVAYGDCSGVTVNTGKAPFKTIDNYGSLTGVSEGALVIAGGALDVSGMAERVIVEPGGSVRVSGIIGRLEIAGTAHVGGQVNTVVLRDGGQITVEGIVGVISGRGLATLISGSVVSGRPTTETVDRFYAD